MRPPLPGLAPDRPGQPYLCLLGVGFRIFDPGEPLAAVILALLSSEHFSCLWHLWRTSFPPIPALPNAISRDWQLTQFVSLEAILWLR
jgi:hypothetical protein